MRWHFPAALRVFTLWATLALVLFLGVTYLSFFIAQTRYFHQRNFRILTAIGQQVDESVVSHSRVLKGMLTARAASRSETRADNAGAATGRRRPPVWYQEARDFVPSLRHVVDPAGLPGARLPSSGVVSDIFWTRVRGDLQLQLSYSYAADAGAAPGTRVTDTVDMALSPILRQIVEQSRYLEAFDAILLTTRDGTVQYATTHSRDGLRFDRIDALIGTDAAGQSSNRFARLAQSTNVLDVTANGTSYKLYLQPCCRTLQAGVPANDDQKSLVIVGLVSSARLTSASLAVSFSVIVVIGGALLLSLLSWPFLKLLMMGETQRVTPTHVLLLGTCSVAGVALLTIFLLDWYAYARFKGQVDRQLQQFATDLQGQFEKELGLAYAQLACLTGVTAKPRPGTDSPWVHLKAPSLTRDIDLGRPCLPQPGDPVYETFALLDAEGMQHQKIGTDPWVPGRISLAERQYFREARDGELWRWQPPADHAAAHASSSRTYLREGIYVDSIRSWTNGNLRLVLAARTTSDAFPVAMIATPIRTLLEPVIVHGFAFAVIDASGTVLFHSDAERSLNENLFAETDDNNRLKAAVAAQKARPLTFRYWGRDYRAYVTPLDPAMPYTLVTLYDKQAGWALQQEWVVASIACVILYLLGFVSLLAAFVLRRDSRASWIWPHPARRPYYVALSISYAGLLAVLAAVATTMTGWPLLVAAVGASAAACALAVAVLGRAADLAPSSGESLTAYTVAAVLCLVLTAAAPGALFFIAAHHNYAETYVKYRQLGLAEALQARVRALSQAQARSEARGRREARRRTEPDRETRLSRLDVGQDVLGVYASFFDDTTYEIGDSRASADCNRDAGPQRQVDLLPNSLEDWLPYQPDTLAVTREFLPDGSRGDRWHWERDDTATASGRLTLCHPAATVQSMPWDLWRGLTAPEAGAGLDPAPVRSLDVTGVGALMGLSSVLLLTIFGLVRVVSDKVFLVGIDAPDDGPWRPGTSGEHEFILTGEDKAKDAACTACIDFGTCSPTAWWDELVTIDQSAQSRQATVEVVHFDVHLSDATLAEAKLDLLEDLVLRQNRVVVLYSRTSPRLVADRTPSLRARWEALFSLFLVRDMRHDVDPVPEPGAEDGPDWWTRLRTWASGWWPPAAVAKTGDDMQPAAPHVAEVPAEDPVKAYRRRRLRQLLAGERLGDPFVVQVCAALEAEKTASLVPFTAGQVRDEIDRRVAGYYRGIWAMCAPQEKMVLAHVALDGLVNPRCRRIVRRLMFRKLLRACPELRLVNRSFERFVLSDERRHEVLTCERVVAASAWDQFRYPFVAALAGGCLFLLVTQKELFDSTLASLGAVATTIPAVVRLVGLSREGTVLASLSGGKSSGQAPRA